MIRQGTKVRWWVLVVALLATLCSFTAPVGETADAPGDLRADAVRMRDGRSGTCATRGPAGNLWSDLLPEAD